MERINMLSEVLKDEEAESGRYDAIIFDDALRMPHVAGCIPTLEAQRYQIAGLQPGDIVTHINGDPVAGARSVYKLLESSGELKMRVYRNGHMIFITVVPEPYSP